MLTQPKTQVWPGLIVPDLPRDEADLLANACQERQLSLIQLVTPTTPRERAVRIAASSSGFLYYVSVAGITGERQALPPDIVDQVRWLKGQTDLPICIGFGISQPDHVRMLSEVADGIIVGSAIVRQFERYSVETDEQVKADLTELVNRLMAAL